MVRAAQSSEKRLSIYGEDIGIVTGSREIEIYALIELSRSARLESGKWSLKIS